ncbi:pilus assembly protein TadE [Janibacter sp. Soil728]|uniref:TadE family type IV pilus minor pilin n=1 Tax=Janibacter sp. Soil728 TaxID=1736393 RepID=UPI0006FEA5A9|nr:TadE family type IV pilus minor pilin [Janibacter sp. Soil728]KRE35064.1 pilus assembly protein TadE [Janibacter sp. Soil728]
MVTAELALTFPAVVVVLVLCLSALSWGVDHVRCVDAARVAVRELARGESAAQAIDRARRTAPQGAGFETSRSGHDVSVTVSSPAPPALSFTAAETSCSSTARMESIDAAS